MEHFQVFIFIILDVFLSIMNLISFYLIGSKISLFMGIMFGISALAYSFFLYLDYRDKK